MAAMICGSFDSLRLILEVPMPTGDLCQLCQRKDNSTQFEMKNNVGIVIKRIQRKIFII
jgi:hypothetical protein